MGIIAALALIFLGLLAASKLILGVKPEAEALLAKVRPIQGWFGVGACIWGLVVVINALLIAGWWLRWVPVAWITYLLSGLLLLGLGFLLGYGLIAELLLSKKAEAAEKGEQVRAKLAVFQVPMGLAAVVLGLWSLIAWFMWRF